MKNRASIWDAPSVISPTSKDDFLQSAVQTVGILVQPKAAISKYS